jgi:hypothetical protein
VNISLCTAYTQSKTASLSAKENFSEGYLLCELICEYLVEYIFLMLRIDALKIVSIIDLGDVYSVMAEVALFHLTRKPIVGY